MPCSKTLCTLSHLGLKYGDLCQAVTELAAEKHASISVGEFQTLNRCLDNAIAHAVTAYVGQWGTADTPSIQKQRHA